MRKRSRWLWAIALGTAASLVLARESASQAIAQPPVIEAALRDLPRTLPTASAEPSGMAVEEAQTKAPASPSAQPQKRPKPHRQLSVRGTATWYCLSGISRCTVGHKRGLYAAISPDLTYLGDRLTICRENTCVDVTVIDCNCQATHSIDLYSDAFRLLAPLSEGRIKVTITKSS